MIPLASPTVEKEAIKAVQDSLENEKFVLGESVFKFEEEFARYIGTDYAISTGSGTSALQLSLLALGAKGTEIATTPNSFIATSNAIIHAGGKPVFSDIRPDTGNIDEARLKQTLDNNPKIKGIVPVHLYGNPCDMDAIKHAAEKNNQFIVEDACQAHGAEYKNSKVGSIGDVGCFSFYTTKNLTVLGDGGMVTTNNEKIKDTISSLRNCGRETQYTHTSIGFTSRLNTINAAIGLINLKKLDMYNEKRREIADVYRKHLPEENLLKETPDSKAVHHLFIIRVQEEIREKVMQHLNNSGIQTGIHYPVPIHLQPAYEDIYGKRGGAYPVSEKFAKEIISIPMHPNLTKEEVIYICEKINEVIS